MIKSPTFTHRSVYILSKIPSLGFTNKCVPLLFWFAFSRGFIISSATWSPTNTADCYFFNCMYKLSLVLSLSCSWLFDIHTDRERGGVVVECQTPNREVLG